MMVKPKLQMLNRIQARRLAVIQQWLAPHPITGDDTARILQTVQQIGCLQLDPISAVARSHWLVLWSRIGNYAPSAIDQLLFQDRRLFEYWAHAASIVLTEDYPIHAYRMQHYLENNSNWQQQRQKFVADNDSLRHEILAMMRQQGRILSRQIEDKAITEWYSSGWTSSRNISQLLQYMWTKGEIAVVGRQGGQKQWGIADNYFPEWTPRQTLDAFQVSYQAAAKALRALGVATARQIQLHFTRDQYPQLSEALKALEADGIIQQVKIEGLDRAKWYIHREALTHLDAVSDPSWQGRTVLLSPFDNLICDRVRTEALWDFNFKIEIYVPKPKRIYGYYVLPILHHDRLIGRIDPMMNRRQKTLTIHGVFAEPDAPVEAATMIAQTIGELAQFLGATKIDLSHCSMETIPPLWREALLAM